ncbi:MAG: ATP-binding cassette domain-containing protein, partial [Paracoccaceae bacterium]|nr:ATP-binding cassette domain-containing protein [Paracoccaceae bacterium]
MADHQPENEPLVEVRDLKVYFPVLAGVLRRKVGEVKAVDKVSLDIMKGETLGLVGESGCGKTTTGRAILRLNDITDGTVKIKGKYIHKSSLKEIRKIRPT